MRITFIQDNQIVRALELLFRTAENEIIILQYQFRAAQKPRPQMTKILNALTDAARRGVKVTILLNRPDRPRRPGPGHGALPKFLDHPNIKILHHKRQEILHVKAACADRHLLILGSHNMSQASFSSSRNISVLIEDAATVREFLHLTKSLLDGASNGTR